MELNAELIKKALYSCIKGCCVECPQFKRVPCQIPLIGNALALILAYEEQIQELTKEGANN